MSKGQADIRVEIGKRVAAELYVHHWNPAVRSTDKLADKCVDAGMMFANVLCSWIERLEKIYTDNENR